MREGSVLPSGTVTFLFTDIERSTLSAAELGDDRYGDLQDTHRALLRRAFEAHGGYEVRTEGDSFFVAFSRAIDAAMAAIDGQRALHAHDWPPDGALRVRMGLHTGDAPLRNGDYVGHDVNKARRICDAGHGGQILISEATAALLEAHLPEGASTTDLGLHRLKDLGDRQHLFQLAVGDLPQDFPPLRSLDAFTHNLPQQRSTFIGREHEMAVIRKLMEHHRLVTLTGIGGCGKTRLALQVGAEDLDRYPDGAFLVELAPLSDPALIAPTLAQAMRMVVGGSLTGGSPTPIGQLVVDHLGKKEALIILDNCEHLLDGCAELVDRIMSSCPNVTILATTREVLEVEGEQSWRVPSLEIATDAANAESTESVRLFEARAKSANPSFELTPENTEAVAEICERLDGLPLAIELAASRVKHMAPRQIAARLNDMFRLLTGGRRRVHRQQTLEASLDWSYNMLPDDERILHRRLAVFAGTFALEAAEDVCSNGDLEQPQIITLLGSLVDKSLVSTEEQGDEIRYRLLEPVRVYAAERLHQAGEADLFRGRHRDHYARWVDSFPDDEGTFGFTALRSFETERGNLRAALEWSAGENRHDLVSRVANGVLTLWWNGGHYDEGFRWLSTAVEHAGDIDLDELIAAYAGLTACSVMRVDGHAREYAARAVELAVGRPVGPAAVALSLDAIASVVVAEESRDVALIEQTRAIVKQAIDIGEASGPAWHAFALVAAGQIELVLRDVRAAAGFLEQAFGQWRLPSVNVVASASALSVARHILGDPGGALGAATIAADIEGEWWQPGMGTNALGLALAGVGEMSEARRTLATSIENGKNWGVDLWLNEVLIFCGAVAFLGDEPDRASRLLAAGRHLGGARRMATPFRTGQSYALYLHYVMLIRAVLGPREAHRTRVEARAMSLDEAVVYALAGLED